MAIKFDRITLKNWKQFEKVDISFHDKLTLITGANASGKTTILNLLGRFVGWGVTELAVPIQDQATGEVRYSSEDKTNLDDPELVGEILWGDDKRSVITMPPNSTSHAYNLNIHPTTPIFGFVIPSHRNSFYFSNLKSIPTVVKTKDHAFQEIYGNSKRNSQQQVSSSNLPNSYFIKETLLAWNIWGFGNKEMIPNKKFASYYSEFQKILKIVLPDSLGFEKFSIRHTQFVMITKTGEFMIDSSSGGISSLIELAWQIFLYQTENRDNFTVIIDEVENHLHASMQREILPDLIKAFPKAHFIVSTHSPLVIGSVKDSNVYVLRYNEFNRVVSEELDLENKAKSATQILNEVLGVGFTMPIWVENSLNEIIDKYSKLPKSETLFDEMRAELASIGLEDLMPEAMKEILE